MGLSIPEEELGMSLKAKIFRVLLLGVVSSKAYAVSVEQWHAVSEVLQNEAVNATRVFEGSGFLGAGVPESLDNTGRVEGVKAGVLVSKRGYLGSWQSDWPSLSLREAVCEEGSWLKYASDTVYAVPAALPQVGGKVGVAPLGVAAGYLRYSGRVEGHSVWRGLVGPRLVRRQSLTEAMTGDREGVREALTVDKDKPGSWVYEVNGTLTEVDVLDVRESGSWGSWSPVVALGGGLCSRFGAAAQLQAIDVLVWLGILLERDYREEWGNPMSWTAEQVRERTGLLLSSKKLQDALAGVPSFRVEGCPEEGLPVPGSQSTPAEQGAPPPFLRKGHCQGSKVAVEGRAFFSMRGSRYGGILRSIEELKELERLWRRIGQQWGANREWVLRDRSAQGAVSYLEGGQGLATGGLRLSMRGGVLSGQKQGYWAIEWMQ